MKKIIDRVTITGADANTKHEDLFKLSEDFPFVELGILLSKSGEGKARYPTYAWMLKLNHMFDEYIKQDKSLRGASLEDLLMMEFKNIKGDYN
jgi:hypothetical protein